MDINGQTAVVIETEHPENEADYYVGIAWDNGEKWFSVDTSGIPMEETIKIARSVKKNTQKLKKVCPVLASSVVLYIEKQLRRFFP